MIRRPMRSGLAVLLLTLSCGGTDTMEENVEDTIDENTSAIPLQILSVQPVDGATGVSALTSVSVTLSGDLDHETVNDSAFNVTVCGNTVGGAVAVQETAGTDVPEHTITFTPEDDLIPLHAYAAEISSAIADTDGVPLEGDRSWAFETGNHTGRISRTLFEAGEPVVASGANGSILAAWEERTAESGDFQVAASWFVECEGWTEPVVINDGNQEAQVPAVTVDDSGNATAVWYENDSGTEDIWWSRFDASGGTWTTPALLSDAAASPTSRRAEIETDTAGNVIAIWKQGDATVTRIYGARYSAGTWGTVTPLSPPVAGKDTDYPALAVNSSGQAVAAWLQQDGTYDSVFASLYLPAGSGWTVPADLIETDTGADAWFPDAGIDNAGNAIVVWRGHTSIEIFANRFDTSGAGWGASETLVSPTSTGPHFAPSLIVAPDGTARAIWWSTEGDNPILTSTYDPSTGWSGSADTLELLETDLLTLDGIQVARDTSGNLFAAFSRSDTDVSVDSMSYDVSLDTWSTPVTIAADTDVSNTKLHVTVTEDGQKIVVWEQESGSTTEIAFDVSKF